MFEHYCEENSLKIEGGGGNLLEIFSGGGGKIASTSPWSLLNWIEMRFTCFDWLIDLRTGGLSPALWTLNQWSGQVSFSSYETVKYVLKLWHCSDIHAKLWKFYLNHNNQIRSNDNALICMYKILFMILKQKYNFKNFRMSNMGWHRVNLDLACHLFIIFTSCQFTKL